MSLPPSSPRLPSPPPPAEIQIGPKSPLMGPNAARQAAQIEQSAIDTNAKRRIHPGTRSADMAAGPPLVPLHELDSAFQLQEHLAALHYYHTASHTLPVSRETAKLLATPPPGIDKTLWLYELCRFLIAHCNSLIVGFLFDTPPCSASTCPEMRAGEWQFLCAVHDTPKSCCAIDYCCHTLDWAANVVTNPKIFPSRFVVDAHDKNTAVKNLVNVFRRLHRIFAHAWFQHRGVFWSVETQSGLYVFFKTVCDAYDLLPAENYKLPPEAEGLDNSAADFGDRGVDRRQQQQPQQQQEQQQQQHQHPVVIAKPPNRDGDDGAVGRTNTRRHIRSSPSTGSAVTTVPEADEDEGADLSQRMREMRISAPTAPADDGHGWGGIPVMVDHKPVAEREQPLRPSSVIPPAAPEATQGSETSVAEVDSAAGESQSTSSGEPTPESQAASEPETEGLASAAAAAEEPAAEDPESGIQGADTGETGATPAGETTGETGVPSSSSSVAHGAGTDAKPAAPPKATTTPSAAQEEATEKPDPTAIAERQGSGGQPQEAREANAGIDTLVDEADAASSETGSDAATVTEVQQEDAEAPAAAAAAAAVAEVGEAEGREQMEDDNPATEGKAD